MFFALISQKNAQCDSILKKMKIDKKHTLFL